MSQLRIVVGLLFVVMVVGYVFVGVSSGQVHKPEIAEVSGEVRLSCPPGIRDEENTDDCIPASRTPALGRLFPLSEDLFVSESGNVGIGTLTPDAPLHISGTRGFNNLCCTSLALEGPGFVQQQFIANGSLRAAFQVSPTGDFWIFNGEGTLKEGLSIKNGGNVGIGVHDPQAKLHIGGTPGQDGIMFPDGTVQTTAGGGGGGFWTASGDDINNTNAGNVGIGTMEPVHKLHVQTNDADTAGVAGVNTPRGAEGQLGSSFDSDITGETDLDSGVVGSSLIGVYGRSNPGTGTGVGGESDDWIGTGGWTRTGRGVFGFAAAESGLNYGVFGQTQSSGGFGVFGNATSTSGGVGGQFQSDGTGGSAVRGFATAESGPETRGGWFQIENTKGDGVLGFAKATSGGTFGVRGQNKSTSGVGVLGNATATSGVNFGVFGQTASSSGWAIFANGPIGGSIKAFQIDHPLDPANRYLRHYCSEGPEPLLTYQGNVVLDAKGEASVELPDYFESINRDFRYQLTPIGAAAPNLHVAQKVQGNRFKIGGGQPGIEISWTVTGVRNDPYVREYGAPVELEKPQENRGKYLRPELYGQPKELGEFYIPEPSWQQTSAETPSDVASGSLVAPR